MKRVAIIGSGISGLAHADVLSRCGFEAVVYERHSAIGGVWAVAYPEVTLQNTKHHYRASGFPWPFDPELHPTGAEVLRYFDHYAKARKLDIRRAHEVLSARRRDAGGWDLEIRHSNEVTTAYFDKIVVAIGQYTEGKHRLTVDGEADFAGALVTERDVKDLSVFDDKRVVVVGFGKSALDMATFAAPRAKVVQHVFRTPRWTLPKYITAIHSSAVLFTRFGSVMMPSWTHPTAFERFLHRRSSVIGGFWSSLEALFGWLARRHAKSPEGKARIAAVLPEHSLLLDLRSAAALAPESYYPLVASGKITPHRAEVSALGKDGVELSTGATLPADVVVLSVGSKSPTFPFFDAATRALLESEDDGVQLYRHVLHPRLADVGFAGFNHGFMHIPAAEIGALWLAAAWSGQLQLPAAEEMERAIDHIRAWKRAHIHFEPSRSCAVNTRFQQYLDIMLADLGISPYRKWPNIVAEAFAQYGPADYEDVVREYLAKGDAHASTPVDLPT